MGWSSRVGRLNRAARREFAEDQPVTIYAADGTPTQIAAIFDRRFIGLNPETGVEVESEQPNLGVILADLPEDPTTEMRVEVAGQPLPFRVRSIQRDGQGMAVLLLYEEPLPE